MHAQGVHSAAATAKYGQAQLGRNLTVENMPFTQGTEEPYSASSNKKSDKSKKDVLIIKRSQVSGFDGLTPSTPKKGVDIIKQPSSNRKSSPGRIRTRSDVVHQ